jgi:hypothetical protein
VDLDRDVKILVGLFAGLYCLASIGYVLVKRLDAENELTVAAWQSCESDLKRSRREISQVRTEKDRAVEHAEFADRAMRNSSEAAIKASLALSATRAAVEQAKKEKDKLAAEIAGKRPTAIPEVKPKVVKVVARKKKRAAGKSKAAPSSGVYVWSWKNQDFVAQ